MGKNKKHNTKTNVRKSLDIREFKTNIKSLDRLLGYDEDLGNGTGIKPGDIIVLRGGPGSGKTTLGLQIMSSYLASDDCRPKRNNKAAYFFSLELEPKKVIDKVKRDFGFFKERKELKDLLEPVSSGDIIKIIRRLRLQLGPLRIGSLALTIISFIIWYYFKEQGYHILIAPILALILNLFVFFLKPIYIPFEKKSKNKITKWIERALFYPSRVSQSKKTTEYGEDIEGILFIDSINVLLTIVRQCAKMNEWKSRLALDSALSEVRKIFSGFVIILSSEFHHGESWVPTDMSESFVSDVEILLSNEPIAVPVDYETSRQGSAGYNIFKIIEKLEGEEGTKLESRSFIRVLKNRKGANQSRRCAYDIVTGVGIQFYETYPGDGHILLFSENPKQKQVWDTFFKEDLPQLYPAIRYEDFDRSSLQRTFLNQRRSRYVPSKTDMYLSSFDNYWINWYGELCWRRAIAEAVKENIRDTDENKVQAAMLISAIHKSLMKGPKELEEKLRKIGIEELEKDWIRKEILTAFASLSRRKNCMKCFLCRGCWWLLNEISNNTDKSSVFNQACAHWLKTRTNDNSRQYGTEDTIQNETTPEISGIEDVLDKMCGYVTECCAGSPVSRFFHDLIESKKSNSISIEQQKKSAYIIPKNSSELIDEMINKIKHVLLKNDKKVLSAVMNELREHIRSDKVLRELEKALWHCKDDANPDNLETTIHQILWKYLSERAGCECAVEFRDYLTYQLSKRMESIKDKPEQAKDSKPEKEIERLQKIYASVLGRSCTILNNLFENLPLFLLEEPVDIQKDDSLVGLWKKCAGQDGWFAKCNIMINYYEILRKRNMYHFLSDIPNEKLRLFGERRSGIIKELEGPSWENKRPIHRPGLLFSLHDTRSAVAIPYNANIGFIVYRHDLLKEFMENFKCPEEKTCDYLEKYVNEVLKLYKAQLQVIGEESPLNEDQENDIRNLIRNNINQYIKHCKKNERYDKGPLQTWEELIILIQFMNEKKPSGVHDNKSQWHFVIETQTLDSLLCTILELLWNCGGNLNIRPDYNIENKKDTEKKLFQALYLLGTMLHKGIIPEDSTLDVTHFAHTYTKSRESKANNKADWVFARHWYSTLVDLLATKKEKENQDGSVGTEITYSRFLWQNPNAELGIMPIPISLSCYLEHIKKKKDIKNIPHISCWGDWHWIMTEGTENNELGIELINNLVSSQKVCERAFQCSAVPTVEEFYTSHGNSNCMDLPERRYDTPNMLPDITFKQLRDMYFPLARSRSQIFDYEHCMLELQSLFHFVRNLAKTENPQWKELRGEIEKALNRIKDLCSKKILAV